LEGFDDSFDTMKAIAEYFRDLAADDRYFGAEPPTPDADMLARIAEREISRRVEARMDASGIVLRPALENTAQTEAPHATEPQATSASVTAPEGAESVATTQPEPAMPPAARAPNGRNVARQGQAMARAAAAAAAAIETPVPPVNHPAPVNRPAADSVAAKLERIRAVVGRSTAATLADSFIEDFSAGEDETDAPTSDAIFADATEAPSVEAPQMSEDYVEDGVDDAIEAPSPKIESPTLDVADVEEDLAPVAVSDADIGQEPAAPLAASQDDEDDIFAADGADVDAIQTETEDDEAESFDALLAELSDDADPEDAASAAAIEDDFEDEDDSALIALMAEADADDDAEATAESEDVPQDVTNDEAPEDSAEPEEAPRPSIVEAARARARLLRVRRDTAETPAAQADEAVVAEAVTEDAEADTVEAVADVATAPAEPQGVNLAELDGLDDLTGYGAPSGGTLSPEDEDELARDLAEAQDNLDAPDDATLEDVASAADAEEPAADQPERAGRAILGGQPDEDEEIMSRIMSQTDAEMAEPAGSRRRQAITQMKAAVAATEAARRLGDTDSGSKKVESTFRDDLTQVVRPRRAGLISVDGSTAATEARSERPRAAPLRLVASQRVDLPAAAPSEAGSIRPRRVSAGPRPSTPQAPDSEATGFAAFAAEMGARSLADTLEAAAAYSAYIEGADAFSRPHVMNLAQEAVDGGFTREDGLRSFGTLLREGRINKIANGRFQVSEDSRYLPDQRAAGG